MGHFHTHCVESGLALKNETRLLPVIEAADGSFEPCAAPIVGMYDYYGGVDVRPTEARPDELRTLVALGKLCQPPQEIGRDARKIWHALCDPRRPVRCDGKVVSYALFDEGIAQALAATAGRVGVRGIIAANLFGHPIEAHHRRWLAALRHAGTALRTASTDIAEGSGRQYGGVDTAREDESVQPLLDAARARYAGRAAMLLAVEVNERGWRELDDEGGCM